MKLETFSYLPEMTPAQIESQIGAIVRQNLVVGIEYTSVPDPRDRYWSLWKLPQFDIASPDAVLAELAECRQANRHSYIKINGYDPVRQGQVVSFVVYRPEGGT